MKLLDSMTEEALKLILNQYDGNSSNYVEGGYNIFPKYMLFSIENIFDRLINYNFIASVDQTLDYWSIYLTPDGKKYFENKELNEMKKTMEFSKLTNSTRTLLQELLGTTNLLDFLKDKFKQINPEEEIRLRGMLDELKSNNIITILWGDGIPTECKLLYNAYVYFEREKEYNEQIQKSQSPNIHIETFNTNSSNIVFGDMVGSTFNIDNSIKNIEKKVNSQGGEDKEILIQLLNEVKEIVENMESSRHIPKNKGFIKRLSNHAVKHGWFYAEIISLVGTSIINML